MASDVAQETFDIVPTGLAVTAMRDNGYKNAAYAIAELMDNSIQAGATTVEMFGLEAVEHVAERARRRIKQVAVLDNGEGMGAETLQIALQFGNGSRIQSGKQWGMGRFGMGLPSASLSQCRRVEVWSWQDGVDSAIYTYLDLDEIVDHRLATVPTPKPRSVPSEWLDRSVESVTNSGTLVVWSNIDRMFWRTAKALISNSQALVGRMYRYWIAEGKIGIRLASFEGAASSSNEEIWVAPNDPLYLMANTSCPEPWNETAMFSPFPNEESSVVKLAVRHQGEEHEVKLTFSMAKPEAREEANAGNTRSGRHAGKNTGISVVRARRELELDTSRVNSYDPRERWWGIEVSFEPGLDDLMGVSNNKQSARNLVEASRVDVSALAKQHNGHLSSARREMEDAGDPLAPLIDVLHRIEVTISEMRKAVERQTKGKRSSGKRHGMTPEEQATEAVRARQRNGKPGESDAGETEPDEKRLAELQEGYEATGHPPEEAEALAGHTMDSGLKYQVAHSHLDAGAFFAVQSRGGVLVVTLNIDHPAYKLLLDVGFEDELSDDIPSLKTRVVSGQQAVEMLLFAWARHEDEQLDPEMRRQTQTTRHEWGRMAESFLRTPPRPDHE